jgi:hypothetical protein
VRARLTLGLFVSAAAAAGAFALSSLAAQPRRTIDASRALDAGPLPGAPDFVVTSTPADPPPLSERVQWIYDLRWDRGDVFLLGVRRLELSAPQATPRAMGRFALELFDGSGLIERVRFDFPLLGVPEPDDAGAPSLTRRLRTRVGVVFPATGLGRRLDLVDRATGRRWALPWPPSPESIELCHDGGTCLP